MFCQCAISAVMYGLFMYYNSHKRVRYMYVIILRYDFNILLIYLFTEAIPTCRQWHSDCDTNYCDINSTRWGFSKLRITCTLCVRGIHPNLTSTSLFIAPNMPLHHCFNSFSPIFFGLKILFDIYIYMCNTYQHKYHPSLYIIKI